MSSIAVQRTVAERQSPVPKTPAVVRVSIGAHRKAAAKRKLTYILLLCALVFVFVHVSLYALMTAMSFERDKLANQFRLEKIENERRRIEYIRRSIPAYIIAWAQAAGMVYSKEFEYLERSKTVASAADDR